MIEGLEEIMVWLLNAALEAKNSTLRSWPDSARYFSCRVSRLGIGCGGQCMGSRDLLEPESDHDHGSIGWLLEFMVVEGVGFEVLALGWVSSPFGP